MSTADEAAALVLRYGWNGTCYQVLNEGMERWFSAEHDVLVGFVCAGRTVIVAGAPICAAERLPSAIEEWETYASSRGWRVIYFGAEERLRNALRCSKDHVEIVLGSQPEWSPRSFAHAVERSASLRAQLNRARNKEVVVEEWSAEKAEDHPELRRVLQEWLSTRGLPPLHFLVEWATLSDLRDRRIFVAQRRGEVIGFVTLCPAPARQGWLTEQFVRGTRAPNGTVELMLYHAAWAVAVDDGQYFTMGIIPLIAPDKYADQSEPVWLGAVRRWARSHYVRFYNFRGLSEFKTKFLPDHFVPVVVIVRDSRFKFSHLRAIVRAFTRGSPEVALAIGLGKAIKTELSRALGIFCL